MDGAPPHYNMVQLNSNTNPDGSQVVPNGVVPYTPDYHNLHANVQQPNGHHAPNGHPPQQNGQPPQPNGHPAQQPAQPTHPHIQPAQPLAQPAQANLNLAGPVGDLVPSPCTLHNPNDGFNQNAHINHSIYNADGGGVQGAHAINIVDVDDGLAHGQDTRAVTQNASVVNEQTNYSASEQSIDHDQNNLGYQREYMVVGAHSMDSIVSARGASDVENHGCNTATPKNNDSTTELLQARGSTRSPVRTQHIDSEEAAALNQVPPIRQQYHTPSSQSRSEGAAFLPSSASENIPMTGMR